MNLSGSSRCGTDSATARSSVIGHKSCRHPFRQRDGSRPRDRRVVVRKAVGRGRVPDTIRPDGFDEAGAHFEAPRPGCMCRTTPAGIVVAGRACCRRFAGVARRKRLNCPPGRDPTSGCDPGSRVIPRSRGKPPRSDGSRSLRRSLTRARRACYRDRASASDASRDRRIHLHARSSARPRFVEATRAAASP